MTSVPGGFQEPNSYSPSPAPSETDDLIAEQHQDLIPNKSDTMTELSRKIPTLDTKPRVHQLIPNGFYP
jgi:hypothetical protein